jgi:hypothetical protein
MDMRKTMARNKEEDGWIYGRIWQNIRKKMAGYKEEEGQT